MAALATLKDLDKAHRDDIDQDGQIFRVYRFSSRLVGPESDKVGIPDPYLFLAAVVVMMTLVGLVGSEDQFNPSSSRVLTCFVGIGFVPLAVIVAGGTTLMAGMEFNQLSVANAFLILAVRKLRIVINSLSFIARLSNCPLDCITYM